MSNSTSTKLDRRSVILAGTALLGTAVLPNSAAAQAGLSPAVDFLASTRKFLSMLDPDKLKAASWTWSST